MKTLLIDLSQVLLAPLMHQTYLDEGLIKHLTLNSLRATVKKFKDYDNIVLCCDSRIYWRKEIFPYYKANRKQIRAKSNLDWEMIFKVINVLKEDLKTYFPYKVIEVERAEADDIIAILVKHLSSSDVLIYSSDSDYKQLHKYKNVRQYNPITEVYIKTKDPRLDLKEKTIRGDRGDNIPSIMSSDNIFALNKRQSPISSKKLDVWLAEDDMKSVLTEEQYRNYKRNDLLINFDNIPVDIKETIISTYNECVVHNRKDLYGYLLKNNLISLLEDIYDF